jgi:hypothetical protein
LITIVCLLIGCEESKTIIESDGSGSQSLIIKKNKADAPLPAKVENDIDYLSEMLISHHHTLVTERIDNMVHGYFSITKDYADIEVFDDTEEPPRATLELGTVKLGGLTLERRELSGVGRRNGIPIVIKAQYAYYPYDSGIISEENPLYLLSGPTALTIFGSPDIRAVDTLIDIPECNAIVNLEPGAVIDPNEDLLLQLKHPIGGSQPAFRNGYIILSDVHITLKENGYHSTGQIRYEFQAPEETDQITIPSETLLEFYNGYKGADLYVLQVFRLDEIAQIPIHDKEGNLISIVSVDFLDDRGIEICFKEKRVRVQ